MKVKKGTSKVSVKTSSLFGPNAILELVKKEIKTLKLEAKSIHTQIQDEKMALEKERVAFEKNNSRESQMEAIKGKELVKLSRLKRMGFEEDAIKEHLEKENKKLQKMTIEKRKERYNLDQNIEKLKNMNEQSERAVTTAELDVKDKITKANKLKDELEEVELKVYALENKVKLSRQTKGVDIMTKSSLRDGIKDVVEEIRARSNDMNVVTRVLKVAGRCLAVDMETPSKRNKDGISDSDSDSSVEISDASSD
jgi:DNA repair exonuclease SbcCD ATPase subunit